MAKPALPHRASPDGATSQGEPAQTRPSLFNTKDAFIERIAPMASAVIYFGSFSLTPEDTSLSRQALYKLSFLHRHFLQPAGLQVIVEKKTVTFSGIAISRLLLAMADILARQIDGIEQVKDETEHRSEKADARGLQAREAIQFLFATDQTLRTGVAVVAQERGLILEGEVTSTAQKDWADQLAAWVESPLESKLKIATFTPPPLLKAAEAPQVDDESLQALVLFRLRLVRDTEQVPVKVKASRGVVTLQGKVRTEALRQRTEKLARSALGVRELRSSLSVA